MTDAAQLNTLASVADERPTRNASSWYTLLKPYIGSPFNAVVTFACLWLIYRLVTGAWGWLVTRAIVEGGPQTCKAAAGAGACWPFLAAKLRFLIFGFYPYDEHWRPALAVLLFLGAMIYSMIPRFWSRRLLWLWLAVVVTCGVLMYGGLFGLTVVNTTNWGGLPLSFMLSSVGLAFGFVLGVLLALARSSKLPAIQVIAVVFIEMVRGVPLVSILFMASVMLPLFMPDGVTIDKLLRAQVAIIIFAGAYIAETVRGGLQAVPKGQHEAAASLGLGYWLSMRKIVLPQALKIVIPPLVNIFIGFFQDTTLVTIIGLLDFLDTVRSAMRDPAWQGIAVLEGYIFAALVYAVFSYGMGSYSRFIERRLKTDHGHGRH
ncbi:MULTISPECIES: amino acid ABC transporter permease [Bosea]|uniref:amino acid ABC transporter permease n=1 Tax=Bosea TaxID=85413 RepID=UPI0021505AEF|nr:MULTISPECIES: amino acid ABC transporter permease [Bosea]MCR4522319.1 amino acid ABC transporter permease [Bosea sp. 47.2.35]MDR6828028.1 general L-amino acid transport system permease protein [Bosea robiniae]MDR6894822.1 general L-amino acid transport system permease protein [Bosea sp. BE109]MDR7138134.1 general L-amino acid transport system permease protein [Bosea sp. BE168]MDR7174833.1 general L-amino acid transport system permease protein [Bosea sp. BE271]